MRRLGDGDESFLRVAGTITGGYDLSLINAAGKGALQDAG
jgi:hypothetical protein